MRLSHFFIDRPVFAMAISIVLALLGAIAFPILPKAQFPGIVPPTVTVTAKYPGATAETLADTVAAPLEQSINGVEKAIYLSSQSTGDGTMVLTITFRLGTDLNTAEGLVQDRVNAAIPQLPDQVQQAGVVVRQASPDLLLGIHLYSPDGSLNPRYVTNYFTYNLRDRLLRTEGVGDLLIRGNRDYAMRIWIDPNRAAERRLSATDIVDGLRNANLQLATGVLNQAPRQGGGAYQLQVQGRTQLGTPAEFGEIVLKSDPVEGITRVRDIGRVELDAQDYGSIDYLSKTPALFVGVLQLPGTNAIKTEQKVQRILKEASAKFPPGLKAEIVYNPTKFVEDSISEVERTFLEALVIVAVVVLAFLQSWRVTLVPLLAIPVSLLGTLAVMLAVGFTLNTLSLFGLVLAIGIVVDDAIVVVENVARLVEEGADPKDAAHRTMDEVSGALVGIALTLTAVFVPSALIPGISGEVYRQFALTIAVATLLSLFVSITLSPALAALIIKPETGEKQKPEIRWRDWRSWRHLPAWAADRFNRGFDWLSDRYGRLTARIVRALAIVFVCYGVLLALTGWRIYATPTGFIPDQDQGNLIANVRMPEGTSLQRTSDVALEVVDRMLKVPGVQATNMTAGFDATTSTPDSAAAQIYVVLTPFADRSGLTVQEIIRKLRAASEEVRDADTTVLRPPPVRGIGTAGGWKIIVEDTQKSGPEALRGATDRLVAALEKDDNLQQVRTTFNTDTPRVYADVDRAKANGYGVSDQEVFQTLQTYLASTYVNTFAYLGRTFQVRVQADYPYRRDNADALALKAKSASTGEMVPLGSLVTLKQTTGPFRILRYNSFPGAEVQGGVVQGGSSGDAIKKVKETATRILGDKFDSEWTEIAYQQDEAGNIGYVAYAAAGVFAYLLLAMLYESFVLPLSVLLIVPLCLLAALVGVVLRGQDNSVLTQVGLLVLMGLAAKNAILIVEFALQDEKDGEETEKAATHAARTRLRPILMTSAAFILGVIPLAFASGAGAELREALGTTVLFGMAGVTIFGLLFVPAFYVAFQRLRGKRDDEEGDGDAKPDLPRLPAPPKPEALPAPGAA